MFRLEFNTTFEDVVRFNEYHFRYSRAMRTTRLIRFWFIPIMVSFFFWVMGELAVETVFPTNLIYGFIAAFAIVIVLRLSVRRYLSDQVKRLYPDNKGLFLGERIAEIHDDHIWLKTPATESKFFFDHTTISIVEDSPRVYVYVAPSVAIIINRNAVKAGDPDQFLQELRTRIAERKTQTSVCA